MTSVARGTGIDIRGAVLTLRAIRMATRFQKNCLMSGTGKSGFLPSLKT